MAAIITIANQKGGTGKTTAAAALAQAAAHAGRRVLAVDMDPQANLSLFLAADTQRPGSYEFLQGRAMAADVIQQSSTGPDIIPGAWSLQTVGRGNGSGNRLKKALASVSALYDYIFIDTPPTPGELQLNAILAASGVIIPTRPDLPGLHGLAQMAETIRRIQQTAPAVEIIGYLMQTPRTRTTLARQMRESIAAAAETLHIPLAGVIREAVAVQEAQTLQTNLFDYAPNSAPALDYMAVFSRLETRD